MFRKMEDVFKFHYRKGTSRIKRDSDHEEKYATFQKMSMEL